MVLGATSMDLLDHRTDTYLPFIVLWKVLSVPSNNTINDHTSAFICERFIKLDETFVLKLKHQELMQSEVPNWDLQFQRRSVCLFAPATLSPQWECSKAGIVFSVITPFYKGEISST